MNPSTNAILKKIVPFLLKKEAVIIIFLLLAIISGLKQYHYDLYNNYKIFKHVYWHTVDFKTLYGNYPDDYFDANHYGPVFSLLIAPFALLPDGIGCVLWNVANVAVFLYGIYSLPISLNKRSIIALICAHEAFTALLSFQFNIALTGMLLLSFSYMVRNKGVQSAFIIALGTLVKIYGIVGLAFLFFIKNKFKFIIACLIAFALLLVLPMAISSPAYVIQSYQDWYHALVYKNSLNISFSSAQDISLMGLIRMATGDEHIPNTPFLAGGVILFGLPYLRISQYKHTAFRLMLLASTLIFTVIFSSGSESPTYIIAFTGIAIWFMVQQRPKQIWVIALLIFAFILTSLSPTDIFPRPVRLFIHSHALKALPCAMIWFVIIYQMMTEDFASYRLLNAVPE